MKSFKINYIHELECNFTQENNIFNKKELKFKRNITRYAV